MRPYDHFLNFTVVNHKEHYGQIIKNMLIIKMKGGASLVAQCLRIRLPMQGTQDRALVWKDPTGRRVAKPVRHSY